MRNKGCQIDPLPEFHSPADKKIRKDQLQSSALTQKTNSRCLSYSSCNVSSEQDHIKYSFYACLAFFVGLCKFFWVGTVVLFHVVMSIFCIDPLFFVGVSISFS